MKRNNWKPETRSLLLRLRKAQWELVNANDGEELYPFKSITQMVEGLTAVEESVLCIRKAGFGTWLKLVYGNSPGELVCDYGIPEDAKLADELDALTSAHAEAWEGRKQPTLEVGE